MAAIAPDITFLKNHDKNIKQKWDFLLTCPILSEGNSSPELSQ